MGAAAIAEDSIIVTKGEFAGLSNVTPGRVSQWIAEGKLTGAALVGEGRSARINVEAARAQLRLKIDIGQRFGNGINTQISASPPAPVADPAPREPPVDPVEEQIKRARLREIEFRNAAAAETELARRGLYVLASDAKAEMTALAGGMLNVFEGALADFATAMAAKFEVPQRDALHMLRTEFRAVRARAAEVARRRANAEPPLVSDARSAAPTAD